MKFNPKFLEAAKVAALTSCGVGGSLGYRLGAVIVYKNKILTAKSNSYKTHPKARNPWQTLHAETRAILSIGLDTCMGKSLYVVRIQRNGELGLALTCSSCKSLIEEVGISNVYYSTYDGFEELIL